MAVEAYCTKCRTKRAMQNAQAVWLQNGRAATQGACPVCNTKLTRLGETPEHAQTPRPLVDAAPRRAAPPKPATGPAPAEISAPLTGNVEAYCVKCKTNRTLQKGSAVYMANGRPAARGECPVCGTGLFKIGATADHEQLPKPVVTGTRGRAKAGTTGASGAATLARRNASQPAAVGASKATPSGRRSNRLVIVESPAKARTVGRFLGKGYVVKASVGHVRDLLKSQLSVDVEKNFAPTYRVPNDQRKTVKDLQEEVNKAKEIYLATDPDREGEAIAWHLVEATGMEAERTRRVVFHEITKDAVGEAFAHPRQLNMDLVNAQQARRILDRLVGYKISPLLWENVRGRTSAGRVQSVALRLVVEREREIEAFVPVEYWSIHARLAQQETRRLSPRPDFLSRLHRLRGAEVDLRAEGDAQSILNDLEGAQYLVTALRQAPCSRRLRASSVLAHVRRCARPSSSTRESTLATTSRWA